MITPLSDRVILKQVEKELTTKSGLVIPEAAKEKPQEGEIVAVGPGRLTDDGVLIPMNVKPGDKVLYGKYAGTEIKLDGVNYLIMHEDDLLGVVEE